MIVYAAFCQKLSITFLESSNADMIIPIIGDTKYIDDAVVKNSLDISFPLLIVPYVDIKRQNADGNKKKNKIRNKL